jgi:hypothetical protein
MRTLIRPCLMIIAAFICSVIFSAPQSVFAQANCTVCISEFRTRGPAGATDEFVELYNNTDNNIVITNWKITKTTSGATGGTTSTVKTITTATIPIRGHFLVANISATNGAYSLNAVASPDQTYSNATGIPDNNGIAIRDAADNPIDQVGFNTNANSREGTGLPEMANGSPGASNEYSYVRKINTTTNRPQDTGDNATDFVLVVADTAANVLPTTFAIPNDGNGLQKYGAQTIMLGAPGPENLASPIESDAKFTGVLYDNTKTASQSPNRCYDSAAGGGTVGSLFIRRNVTNNSAPTNQLRVRVVDITTASNPAPVTGKAIIKPMTSTGTGSTGCPIPGGATLQTTTLDAPSVAANGGLNSTLSTTPIPASTNVNIEYRLAADRTGTFTYLFIYEAK